jgi:predicted RND superfamily exporter protein
LAAIRVTTRAGDDVEGLATALEVAAAPLSAVEGITAVVSSEPIVEQDVADSLSSSQVASLSITLTVAAAVLVLAFWVRSRRPLLGLITILPVALVVLWTYGMMAIVGIPFAPSTAMVAAIAIGVGVDYTIHVVHRFTEDRARHETRTEALHSTLQQTGGALAGAALTTLAGFGILVTSTLEPFRQLGAVVVFAISFSLVAAVIVLPAMLVLWDGHHRRRGASRETVPGAVDSGQKGVTR